MAVESIDSSYTPAPLPEQPVTSEVPEEVPVEEAPVENVEQPTSNVDIIA